ncbi:transcriptional regulator [Oenococcus oeni]|uniref:SIS domain-containing protein n=1 Tax=Oenococcus oeni TaxID=1247 RepID=A0A3S7H5B6_OENOE|nr:MurR/RpiR family transcriptional regulator [Oenococcus oeni]AVI94682.1 transcriptional regulator [Oenococcus oeni]MDV7714387.1 SIS domain-containing protein [Oenococcus oeni]OIK56409.1 transcriptional regulator [Oenococcus oeni]OIM22760.1 transcriptional regulator [Oenococcus oeni]OIM23904.1 transcriptional regulator [Oenococcus oeni]
MQNVTETIRSYYEKLHPGEKRIADYILSHQDSVMDATIQSLSDKIGISTASISRFTRHLGYPNFRDFLIALSASKKNSSSDFFTEIKQSDQSEQIVKKLFSAGIAALTATAANLNMKDLDRVVDWLVSSNKIGFFGIGGSSIVAFNAYHKFLRTNLNIVSHPDYDIQIMQAAHLTSEDLGIVISHSGRNQDTLLVENKLRENGSKIVAITAFPESPIAKNADIVLNSYSEEVNFRQESMSSLVAQITIIDTLFTLVGHRLNKQTDQVINSMRRVIEQTRVRK